MSPVVQNVCRTASAIASETRQRLGNIRTADPIHRLIVAEGIKSRAAGQVNRIANQVAPMLDRLPPREVDMLVGCLARVEHSIGRSTAPVERLRAAAHRRLAAAAP
jgi:hypothetical protein